MRHSASIILLLVSATVALSCAATNEFGALTLDEALAFAETHHPDLAEATALADAAKGRAKYAGAFPNPEAVARMESAPFRGKTAGDAEYLGGVAQSIPLGARLSKARQVEELDRERLLRTLEVKRRDIRRRVHSAFATALYQEQADRTLAEFAADADKLAAATKARLEAGDALPEHVARAEMELARAVVELKRTQSLREQAMAALAGAMGDATLRINSLLGSLDNAFEIPTLESLASSLSEHPATSLATADMNASRARVNLAQAERVPDIQVELLYHRLQAERRDSLDMGISIPLPFFDRNRGKLQAAQAETAAAEARARSTRNELDLRMRQSYAQLTAALTTSRILKNEVIPKAETVRKAAETRYAAGDISLNEVLPVRRDWAAVQLTYLESLRDVMQAWANIGPFLTKSAHQKSARSYD